MAPSIGTLRKRKRDVPPEIVTVGCLECRIQYRGGKYYKKYLNGDEVPPFCRVVCAALTNHIQDKSKCLRKYKKLGKAVITSDNKYCFDMESSMVGEDGVLPTANNQDEDFSSDFSSDYVYHPQDLGISHQNPSFGFNRSINTQTIAIPSQNIESSLLETLNISNEEKGGNTKEDNSVSLLCQYGDRNGSESEESEPEPEEAEPTTIPRTTTTFGSTNVEIPTIDSNEEEFQKNISNPQLTPEIDLMNIMTQHKMPLTAFKTIFNWAKRSQGLEGFDFAANCTETRGRHKILSEIRRISQDKNVDEFKPQLVSNWLPLKKATKVYVRDFQTALKSLLTNKSLVNEENLCFPDPKVPYIWEEFPDPWDDKERVIKELCDGRWWVNTWKEKCLLKKKDEYGDSDEEKEILIPIIFYMDGISLDNHGRLKLTPLNMTLGCFNTKARRRPDAWETIYFHPDDLVVQIAQNSKPPKPFEKVQNLHSGLEVALKSFVEVCQSESRILWRNIPYGGKLWNARLRFSVAFVVGDTLQHDQLCGSYTSYNNTKKMCRHCDIDAQDLVKPECQSKTTLWLPSDFQTNGRNADYFKNISHHPIRNAFDRLDFGWNKHQIHLATPGELLHMHQLGCMKRAVESFEALIYDKLEKDTKRSGSKKKAHDNISLLCQIYGAFLRRQSDRDFPRASFTSTNILKTTMKEAKHYAAILLCLMLALLTPSGQYNFTDQDRAKQDIDALPGLICTIEWLLGMEEFLKNGELTVGEVPRMRTAIDEFIRKINANCRRNADEDTGSGTRLLKNHLYFHLHTYMEYFGPMKGWDSSSAESSHKTEIKAPSKNTQLRPSELIKQTGIRQSELRLLRRASYKFLKDPFQEEAPPTSSHYPIYGPKFFLKKGSEGEPVMVWEKKDKHRSLLPPEVIEFCVEKVLPKVGDSHLNGFTEHQRKDEASGKIYRFRAHCCYGAKDDNGSVSNKWHDWATFTTYDNRPPYPCHIMCFLHIKSVHNPPREVSGGYFIDEPGVWAVVRRFTSSPAPVFVGRGKNKYQSSLITKGKLESEFRIVSCELLQDAVAVVPIVKERDMDSDQSNYVYDDDFFVVKNRNGWAGFFHEQIRTSEPKQEEKTVD